MELSAAPKSEGSKLGLYMLVWVMMSNDGAALPSGMEIFQPANIATSSHDRRGTFTGERNEEKLSP